MLKMGTRGSALALLQSQEVQRELQRIHPGLSIDIAAIKTLGDQNVSQPFSQMGQKGVFTKEIDEALLSHRIDFATHSLKDLPSEISKGLCLISVPRGLDARDALISREGQTFVQLKEGSVIGTSSARRQALIVNRRPDLRVEQARGNVDTRLRKLFEGQWDAIVLACAGLMRLGYRSKITEYLDPRDFIPAVGQGFLGIVCREDDVVTRQIVEKVNDPTSHRVAQAQRIFMTCLEGGCRVPLGCHVEMEENRVRLIGFLAHVDGTKMIKDSVEGDVCHIDLLAKELANCILMKGGKDIVKDLRLEKKQ